MKNFLPFVKKTASLLILMLFIASATMAQITVTPAFGGSSISADKAANATAPAFTALGDIVINETGTGDFDASTTTIVLNAPTGWTFNTSGVTTSLNGGNPSDLTVNSVSYTSTQITLSVTIAGNANTDALTISGVQVMSAFGSPLPNAGNITITSDGTSSITQAVLAGSLSQIAGAATNIAVGTGNNQTATAGTAVAIPPNVLITDQFGNPVSGVSVVFAIASGSGSVAGGSATTDASGIATVTSWTLGTGAGVNTLTATSGSLTNSPITFSATGTAGAAANIALNTGDGQSAAAGTAVATAPSALVTDVNGNPVSGVSVTFAIATGGGSVTGGSATTDASGIATVGSWTLGATAGANTITAANGSLTGSPVTFTATGTTGAATIISLNLGDAQSATAGTAVAVAPSVLVTDAGGNPISGVSVTFAIATGGGTVTGGSATTNAIGIATVGSWTLGAIAGTNTLTATSGSLTGSPVTFTATGTTGAAAIISLNAGDGQTAAAGTAVATVPSVLVTDAGGNPVSGVSVTFAIATGGGNITGGSATTNASGIATVGSWTLGPIAGTNTMTATSGSLTGSPVTFTATGTTGSASIISLNAGNGQTAVAGTAVATAPSVLITDAGGNPVSGVSVTFVVASGGGSVTGGTTTTNVSGIATVGSWTLGATAGSNTLTVTNGLTGSPITFTATGTAGAASIISLNAGNGQTAAAGTAVATAPSVLVTDAGGNPVSGVSVTFAIATGGGSVTLGNATTNGSGIATVGSWTLGAIAGTNTLTATSGSLTGSPVTFTATGTAGAATTISLNAGNGQTAAAGTAVATAPSVLITDAGGNPVSGVSVTFVVASGGGSVTGGTTTTNVSGIATVGSWTLGAAAGSNTLTVTNGLSGSPITFTATGTVGALSKFAISTIGTQTAGTPFTITTITAQDAAGNTITSFTGTVTLSTSAAFGSVSPTTSGSFVNGVLSNQSITVSQAIAQTITATSGVVTGTSNIFTVNAGALVKMQILLPGETAAPGSVTGQTGSPTAQLAGTAFNVVINAVDANFNIVSTTNTVGITSTDGAAALPANGALAAGTRTVSVTLNTIGSQTITATNITTPAITADVSSLVSVNGFVGQTIVNYNFNAGGSFGALTPVLATGITCTAAGSAGFNTTGGTVTGANAFTTNTPAGNALESNTNNSWTFTVGGANLPNYKTFRIYYQAGAIAFANTTVTVSYSLNAGTFTSTGVTYTLGGTPTALGTSGAYFEAIVALPTSVNNPTTSLAFRLTLNNTFGGAGLDNFQVQAISSSALVSPPALTAAVGATLDNPFNITFTDNAAWRAAITSVQYGTTTLVAGTDYVISAGQIQIIPGGAIKIPGTQTITVIAAGYTNATVVQPISVGAFAKLLLLLPGESAVPGSVVAGPGKTGTPTVVTAGAPFTVTVQAVDKYWNPVTSTDVVGITSSDVIAVLPANAALSGGSQTFSVTLKTAGSKTVTASDVTSPSKTANLSTVTVNPGAATTIAISAGDGQSANVGTAVATDPSVIVKDAFGNPVTGVTVTFAVASGGGSVTGASQTTNASGIATVTSWTMGAAGGTNTMTATSVSLTGSPVTFTATAIPLTITTGTIAGSPFCAGSAISIPFTSSGIYSAGNVYTAQLSSSGGSFGSPVSLGTLTSTANSGTINGTIPAGTTTGTGYIIRVISSNPAVTGSLSSAITINATLPASVSITANPGNTICAGTSVTFTAAPTNGGTTPSYQWKVNGVNAGTNSPTFTTTTLTNGQAVTVVMTSNATPCLTGSPATSNSITMTVNPNLPASVSIVSNAAGNTICSGASVTFTATPVNGGTPSYQWQVNGVNAGTNSAGFTTTTLNNGDIVKVIMTSNATCATGSPATSNLITMTVNPNLPASVSIAANPGNTICAGASVTFTATPINGGTTPVYQWKVNGTNSGTNSPTFTTTTLTNGQIVTVVMTSNATCVAGSPATSNGITMTVNPSLPASVSIAASPSNSICTGTSVTFTATATNGGSTPAYQWKVNGTNAGTNSATFTSTTLNNTDAVTVVMTSNASPCLTGSPATSNTITMAVSAPPTITGTLAACVGGTSILTGSGTPAASNVWTSSNPGAATIAYSSGSASTGPNNAGTGSSAALTGSSVSWASTAANITSTGTPYASLTIPGSGSVRFTDYLVATNYGFNIPTTATITNISVNIRRMTTDNTATISDNVVSLLYNGVNFGADNSLGASWPANSNFGIQNYAGSLAFWGAGTLTATQLNSPLFGVALSVQSTSGSNRNATVDYIQVTVTYTSSAATATVTAVAGGTTTITYTNSGGCSTTQIFTVNPLPTATITGTASVCQNATAPNVTFTGANGTAPYTFTYKIGTGSNQTVSTTSGNSVTVAAPTGTAGSFVYTLVSVQDASSTNCSQTQPGTATITVNPNVAASVSIAASPSNTICAGSSVTFTATPVNGGTPSYQWLLNGANVGTNSATFTTTGLVNGDQVKVVMTSTAACVSGSPATSNTITMTVNPALPASVSIASNDADNTICAGSSITFTATPTNGGTPAYQWKVNGTNVSGQTASTFSPTNLTNGQTVTVVMTSNATCATGTPATSNGITIAVNALPTISGTLNACASGGTSQLTGSGTAAAVNPWLSSNGAIATVDNTGFVTAVGPGTTTITYTNNNGCQKTATFTVNALLPASVSIVSNKPSNTSCAGTSVQFTATPINGGSPAYQWKINGTNAGTNSTTFTTTALNNGDVVTVVMTSNATCATGSPATSNAITMIVNPNSTLTLASGSGAASQGACSGTAITTITFTVGGGGTSATVTNLPAGLISNVTGTTVTISGTPTAGGTYTVATTGGGCTQATANGTITINQTPTPIVITPSAPFICNGSNVQLNATGGGGVTPVTLFTDSFERNGFAGTNDLLPNHTPWYTTVALGQSSTNNNWSAPGLSGSTPNCGNIGGNHSMATCVISGASNTTFLCSFLENSTTPAQGAIVWNDGLNTTGYNNIKMTFSYQAVTPGANDYGEVVYSKDGGVTWNSMAALTGVKYRNQSSTLTATVNFPADFSDHNNYYFGFSWHTNSGSNTSTRTTGGFRVDNIIVTGTLITNPGITWLPAAGLSATTGTQITASPTTTTKYYATSTVPSGCSSVDSVTVTVNPAIPSVGGQAVTICGGSGDVSFIPAGMPSGYNTTTGAATGVTYTWGTPTYNNVTGSYNPSYNTTQQSSVIDHLTNTSNSPVTAIYNVTPSFNGSCSGTATTFALTVTVYPAIPALTPQTATICTNQAFTYLPVGMPNGVTYTWSTPSYTGSVTGGVAGSSVNSITGAGTLVNSGVSTGTATYTVTPSYSGGCTGADFTITVSVNPSAASTFSYSNSSYCATGTVTANFTGTTGGTFSYVNASNVAAGLSLNSSDGSINMGTSTAGVYTVTYTIPASGGCSSYSPPPVQVTVLALPALQSFNIAGSDVYYCTPGPGYDIKLQGSEVGVSYQLMYDNGLGGGPVAVGAAKPGTTVNGGILDFGFKTPLGAYTVVGTNTSTGCFRTVSAQEIDLHSAPAPHLYNLTVNGVQGVVNATVCAGGQSNNANSLTLGISNTDNFASYTLFMDDGNGNVTQVDAQVGTGAAITFAPISTSGLYYIYAGSNCGQQLMNGQVQVTVTPLPGAVSLAVTQPSCNTPTATLTVTSPETTLYSLDGNPAVAQTSFTVLAGTTHTVAAFNGTCYGPVTSVTVNAQPATPVKPTVSVTQPNCSPATNSTGTITVTAPAGLGYSYSIDGSDYTNTSGIFSGQIPGTYHVTVSNGTCVSADTTVTILSPSTLPGNPTALVLTPGSASITGSFTAPVPAPTNYLVIRTLSSTAPSAPVTGTTYTAGTFALGGFIAAITTAPSFTDNAVTPGTTYWYWVYAYNAQTCTLYSTGNISGSATPNSCSSTTVLYWAGVGSTVPGANSVVANYTQFNNPINWSISNSAYSVSANAPTACTDIVMNLSTGTDQIIPLSAAIVANSLTINLFGATKNTVDVGPYVLTLLNTNSSGALAISAGLSGSSKAYLTTEGGTININGAATIGAPGDAGYSYIGNGDGTTSGGNIRFRSDVTFNPHSAVSNGAFISATFDAASTQTWTNNTNSGDANVGANAVSFHDVRIGNANAPAVTLAGSSSGIDYVNGGNLTISANSSLTIPSGYGLNQLGSSAGIATLGSGATLRVGGTASGTNSVAGSNFPGGFASYAFDCVSTTEYYGATQTVFSGSSYGNLTITTAGIKTAGGNLNVCSNVLINPAATFAGSTFSHTVGGNWTNKGAFTPNSSTVAFNGSNSLQQIIGGPISTTFNSLTINNSTGVTLIDPANTHVSKNVNAVLTLTNGLLTTDANDLLILGNDASTNLGDPNLTANYYQTASYVNGPLQKIGSTDFTFPVGKASSIPGVTGYQPITISAASDHSVQTYTAEYIHTSATSLGPIGPSTPQLVHVSGCDYWRLDNGSSYPTTTNNSLAGGATANLTMYWNPNNSAGCSSNYVTNLSTLAIGHLDYATGQSYAGLWDPIGLGAYTRTGSNVSGSIQYVGVSTFSPFSLATLDGTDNPLPIKLDYFTATKAVGFNKLTWKAECTSSSAGFEVERSSDGVSFTGIHYVAVNNATDCSVPFVYDDYTSSGTKVYYRIKMIDIDGNVTYSEIKLILNDENTIQLMSIKPNPLQSEGWLEVTASQSNKIELVILTIDGREMTRKTVQLQAGSNTINMNTASFAKGMYIVRGIFSNGGQTNVIPFIKQ